jgi:hypothetical protein
MMDEQVRAFDEAVAAAPLACERATPGNATKQAKAVKPPRRALNRRAVRPIKPPSVGSAPGRDLALDARGSPSVPKVRTRSSGRNSSRSFPHDGCIRASPMTGVTAPRLWACDAASRAALPLITRPLFRARCASNSKVVSEFEYYTNSTANPARQVNQSRRPTRLVARRSAN